MIKNKLRPFTPREMRRAKSWQRSMKFHRMRNAQNPDGKQTTIYTKKP